MNKTGVHTSVHTETATGAHRVPAEGKVPQLLRKPVEGLEKALAKTESADVDTDRFEAEGAARLDASRSLVGERHAPALAPQGAMHRSLSASVPADMFAQVAAGMLRAVTRTSGATTAREGKLGPSEMLSSRR